MTRVPISVLIPTRNEERNLQNCLNSVAFADDVIVFDSLSDDRTTELALKFGARVVQRAFDNFSDHKNWALDHINFRHAWILILDADERATPELQREIEAALRSQDGPTGYYIARKIMMDGRWLRHGGRYPDFNLRLFRRDCARYEKRLVHEHMVLRNGRAGYLTHPLLHDDDKGIERWYERHNTYSTLEAMEIRRELDGDVSGGTALKPDWRVKGPQRTRALKHAAYRWAPFRPLVVFLWLYLFKRGFMDGAVGLRYCALRAFYEHQISLKLEEISRLGSPLARTYAAWRGRDGDARLNILHVIGRLSKEDGGPPRACLDMARVFSLRGHNVAVITTDHRAPPPDQRPENHHGVKLTWHPVDRPHRWLPSRAMGRALEESIPKADIVIVHGLYLWHSLAAGKLCRAHGIPYVIRTFGTLDPYIRKRRKWAKLVLDAWYQKSVLRHAAAIHYTAEEEFHLARPAVGHDRAIVTPLGMFPEDLPPPASDRRTLHALFPETAGKPTAVFIGRLHPKKGVDVLIRAVRRLHDDGMPVQAVVLGNDDGAGVELRRLTAALDLSDAIHFGGYVDGERKWEILSAADVFVLPSHSENFGLAVAEAMFMGIPVIVSKGVNLQTDVTSAKAGWVAEATPESIAETMRKAFSDPIERAARGRAAKELAHSLYNWHVIGDRLETAFRAIRRGELP